MSEETTDGRIAHAIEKYLKIQRSDRLDKDVYVLIDWLDISIFKANKKFFGYTDIGWTVKHPELLASKLLHQKIWSVD